MNEVMIKVPEYELDFFKAQEMKFEIEPHFISHDYVAQFNQVRNYAGELDYTLQKPNPRIDYELISQLGAKHNTYPTEDLREQIDAMSTFLIKNAMKHLIQANISSLCLRDLLPSDLTFQNDIGLEAFPDVHTRMKPWHQVYDDYRRIPEAKAMFTGYPYKEIIIYGFRNIDPEFKHTTAAIQSIDIYLPMLVQGTMIGRKSQYILRDYPGYMYIGTDGASKNLPEDEITKLKDLYRTANVNQSELSVETFISNVNHYLCYLQRGLQYQLNFNLVNDESKINEKIKETKKIHEDDGVFEKPETFIKICGLVVEPMGVTVV